jgi:UDP-2-acetamido-3-amino-2,3-dideoxy-glucuronate N-acetyltransferase
MTQEAEQCESSADRTLDGTAASFFGGCARLITLAPRTDMRGSLLPLDFAQLPFLPCRAFVVRDVPAGTVRGRHAHRRGSQLLVRLTGRVLVDMRFEGQEDLVTLDRSDRALLIGPGVWAEQTYLDPGSILLVLASDPYDPHDYLPEPA